MSVHQREIFDRDTAAMLAGEFAEAVSFISPATGESLPPVSGIYDETYLTIDPETQVEHAADHARVTIVESESPIRLQRGRTELEIRGRRRVVYDIQRFGQGTATLLLHDV